MDAIFVVYLLDGTGAVVENLHQAGAGEGCFLTPHPGRYSLQINASRGWDAAGDAVMGPMSLFAPRAAGRCWQGAGFLPGALGSTCGGGGSRPPQGRGKPNGAGDGRWGAGFADRADVDDHPLFCDALSMTPTGPVGIGEVAAVGSLAAALDRLEAWPLPDVLLLDLNLPDLDGIEGVVRMRQAAPIIVVCDII